MRQLISFTVLTTGLVLALAGQAHATSYEYSFLANPDADSEYTPNTAQDVQYTFGFNDAALPGYSLNVLRNPANWLSGAIWLKATYQGKTVNFADGLNATPGTFDLSFTESSGVIEVYGDLGEFLDVDLHPFSPFVVANQLPFTPFVGGQLDVYDSQKQFQDAFAVWNHNNLSSLPAHAVPEPSTWACLVAGLLVASSALRHRQKRAK